MSNRIRTLFLSHGGGPLPLLGDASHQEMIDTLKTIAAKITKPSAIIVISAHWEEDIPTITSSANPELIYDYYGFPPEAYEIKYGCPGEPKLASAIQSAFAQAGIQSELDANRGFDHGLFIPLKLMYPEADIPCVQVSLCKHLNPEFHIQMGEALRNLEYENLLILGSGFTFHNMKAFREPPTAESTEKNQAFERWLIETMTDSSLTEKTRKERLNNWMNAPHARYCHPREEHLLPLHVCYGSNQSPCKELFEIHILNKKTSLYLW